MIFGRSTVVWMGLITVLLQFLKQVVPILAPGLLTTEQLSTVFDGLNIVMGAAIALIAGTSTTPISDPRLVIGQTVNAGQRNEGVVVPAGSGVGSVPRGTTVVEAPAVVVDSVTTPPAPPAA